LLADHQPAISVDTKKKELVGETDLRAQPPLTWEHVNPCGW
jgi:hypothetical protein